MREVKTRELLEARYTVLNDYTKNWHNYSPKKTEENLLWITKFQLFLSVQGFFLKGKSLTYDKAMLSTSVCVCVSHDCFQRLKQETDFEIMHHDSLLPQVTPSYLLTSYSQ